MIDFTNAILCTSYYEVIFKKFFNTLSVEEEIQVHCPGDYWPFGSQCFSYHNDHKTPQNADRFCKRKVPKGKLGEPLDPIGLAYYLKYKKMNPSDSMFVFNL